MPVQCAFRFLNACLLILKSADQLGVWMIQLVQKNIPGVALTKHNKSIGAIWLGLAWIGLVWLGFGSAWLGSGAGLGLAWLASRELGAGSREPGAGRREPGAGNRGPGAGRWEP